MWPTHDDSKSADKETQRLGGVASWPKVVKEEAGSGIRPRPPRRGFCSVLVLVDKKH